MVLVGDSRGCWAVGKSAVTGARPQLFVFLVFFSVNKRVKIIFTANLRAQNFFRFPLEIFSEFFYFGFRQVLK
jgi:hypothetical protein